MIRLLLLKCFLLFAIITSAETITVKDIAELNKANKSAKPGDVIILQNGEWKDVIISLNCMGTKEQHITFKAQQAGKVIICGHSQLKLGGSFIDVDGWLFTNGYAGNDAVIDFRIDKKQLANNCRVTNTAIDDFNNPKRLDENYWVSFSGKNNRIDHCTFQNKKNMGVLMAIILDDDRSRENFHSIDHNYFGFRLPLASNSGEIIRIGVSQHCEFNSNTQVVDNFFEHCDGETEIVSVKSCSNVVRNNLFKECQGGVVLRHGHYNTVENNIFLGNNKEGTGGVRIINRGQWVVNNLFYKCRGVGFRSPLSVMNGVPNSPAFRYVPVTDAKIVNNSFYECAPISLCEGSDTERSMPPSNVIFANNIFYNSKDKIIYNVYDNISGFTFASNAVSSDVTQTLANGFVKTKLSSEKSGVTDLPHSSIKVLKVDSLNIDITKRLTDKPGNAVGFADAKRWLKVNENAHTQCGAKWFEKASMHIMLEAVEIDCNDSKSLISTLQSTNNNPLRIHLTGTTYQIDQPIVISGKITLTSDKKAIKISSGSSFTNLFEIKAGSRFTINDSKIDLTGLRANNLITSDLSGSGNHSVLLLTNNSFSNMNGTLFNAAKATVFDSIIVKNNAFNSNKGTLFDFNNETDKKGYYDVEQLKIVNNYFSGNEGQLIGMVRSGNDESTMGPLLLFKNNIVDNCSSKQPLIYLFGTQLSFIESNRFTSDNSGGVLIKYEDNVRAVHMINNNSITKSGSIEKNKFVTDKNNNIQ